MVITVAGVITLMVNSDWVSGVMSTSTGGTGLATGSGNVTQLGDSVFTTYLLAFEATAGLLIIAVVGAVLLARRERPADPDVEVIDVEKVALGVAEEDEGEWWIIKQGSSEEVES